jgi:CheY-like chemotaxis protein
VAHDFNNLLTPILASLDMLQRQGVGGDREQRLIRGALQSAERAKVLVHRLLAFARRQPLQSTPTDMGALLTGMAELMGSTMGPQVTLALEVPEIALWATADPHQLELAILNLCVNARDAMEGRGQLTLKVSAEQIEPGSSLRLKPGGYVRLSVADDGKGMDEPTLARAIEPFFSTKGVGKGTGLGLSMAHGLALQLGGALMIDSAPDRGTDVSIWLPACAAMRVDPSVDTIGSIRPLAEISALLVDDEEAIRVITADMLNEIGFKVHDCPSAEAALLAIDSGLTPDLLITDHLMPGMTGIELAQALTKRWPGLKILLVSGFAEVEGVDSSLPRLTKPFVQGDLVLALADLGFPCRDVDPQAGPDRGAGPAKATAAGSP